MLDTKRQRQDPTNVHATSKIPAYNSETPSPSNLRRHLTIPRNLFVAPPAFTSKSGSKNPYVLHNVLFSFLFLVFLLVLWVTSLKAQPLS